MQGNTSSPTETHSDLSVDQQLKLFPSFGYHDAESNTWRISQSLFAFNAGNDNIRQRMFLRLVHRVLKTDETSLRKNAIFQERIRGFLDQPVRGKTVVLKFGEHVKSAPSRSRRSGHVKVGVTLDGRDIPDALRRPGGSTEGAPVYTVRRQVVLPPGDVRVLADDVPLIPERGISVISDIDDTIKISQVAHRRQLLQNTFINPFVAVPGMATLFDGWRAQGVVFHYVSSSPWQLYEPLKRMLGENGFPAGSFHLRNYRFGDPSVLRLFLSRKRNKYNIIKSIFRMFPGRRFILIGDSGEKDPEVYGKVARKFPNQIERILIRRVEGRSWTRERVAKCFRKVPRELWQAFRVPTQITPLSSGRGSD